MRLRLLLLLMAWQVQQISNEECQYGVCYTTALCQYSQSFGTTLQVDMVSHQECNIPDEQLFLLTCSLQDPRGASLPLPVVDVRGIPRIATLLNASYDVLTSLVVETLR